MGDETKIVPVEIQLGANNTQKYQQIEDELEELKVNLNDLSDKAMRAVSVLADVAEASQNFKYYEALAKLIDSASKVNKDASDVIKQKQMLLNDLNKLQPQQTINNTYVDNRVVHMTTTDMIEEIRNEEESSSENP